MIDKYFQQCNAEDDTKSQSQWLKQEQFSQLSRQDEEHSTLFN